MDEFATFVQHSDCSSVKIMPLLYLPNGVIDSQAISYSLLWPTCDIDVGEPIYRDFLVGIDEAKHRSCRLSVWFDIPFLRFTTAYK